MRKCKSAARWILALALALALSPARARVQELSESRVLPEPARSVTPLARAQARYLILCLDGIGYDLVEEMYRRGELRHFHPPAPLIAPFPTLTNLALVEILAALGAPPARGYEDYYFGPDANKMRGGFFHRFRRETFIEGSYREIFHYHPHALGMTLEYSLPVLGPWVGGRLSVRHIRGAFLKSREPLFLAYIDSTDPGSHIEGKWMPRDVLRRVDRLAGELGRRARVPVEVVVFSDHGNAYTRLHKADLGEALERAGFRVEGRLVDSQSVVIPQYGLISAAVLYTQPGREAAVARAVLAAAGAELVAYRTAEAVYVLSGKDAARILRRGQAFRYEPLAGDPLALAPLLERLPADAEGFAHEDDWFAVTGEHIYPDPLRRLWFAFESLVEQPASVIVSLKDDYYTGSGLLDFLGGFRLRATHGSLRRSQSFGFAMSTAGPLLAPLGATVGREGLPRALRARDLWARLTHEREQVWTRLRLPARRCLTLSGPRPVH